MTPTISLQITLDSLIQAVTSLDIDAKRHLLDIIEQQIFEAEEASYEEDADTKAEIDAVKLEYQQGEFMTIDDFIQAQST
ncbi:hypothetical protein IQ254_24700 [Nodosilinea sp. LEGE 07088]|uniref:hypothetical protein n=1 Tax=Nodosilinea sp. LEGE 07088 TaxID=2777968 RepID=UPI001882B34C|nr:hypothetical protein [Nodosilinea sp. LEGE 07088]MBE9140360.1 hypothetical protein [Nodosilinea sp. LEGE 07088]